MSNYRVCDNIWQCHPKQNCVSVFHLQIFHILILNKTSYCNHIYLPYFLVYKFVFQDATTTLVTGVNVMLKPTLWLELWHYWTQRKDVNLSRPSLFPVKNLIVSRKGKLHVINNGRKKTTTKREKKEDEERKT